MCDPDALMASGDRWDLQASDASLERPQYLGSWFEAWSHWRPSSGLNVIVHDSEGFIVPMGHFNFVHLLVSLLQAHEFMTWFHFNFFFTNV